MRFTVLSLLVVLTALPAFASSHLVTGNGHGFAVVDPDTARITKFYAHPYSYTGPVPGEPYAEGIETTNFLDSIVVQVGPTTMPKVEFVNDSHIIRVARPDGGVFSCFMPFGLKYSALVLVGDAERKKVEFLTVWAHNKSKLTYPKNKYQAPYLLQFEGIKDSILEIPLDSDAISLMGVGRGQIFVGSWVLISIENESEVAQVLADFEQWRSKLSAQQLLDRELTDFEAWRVQPTVKFKNEAERHLWRQSETMLRIAQSREENRPGRYNHGMIVACLPDGVFFTHWVRDMAWATLALIRMGHQAEAREAILAYFNARPTGKMRAMANDADYQISVVRYFGNGEEEPFFTMEGQPNIEFDNWGEVLWVLGQYIEKYGDISLLNEPTYRGPLYQSARDYIVKPLLVNLETYKNGLIVSADTSIWEEHQKDKKHFAFSSAMAIQGLDHFSKLAFRYGEMATHEELDTEVLKLREGFEAGFIHNDSIHGTLEPVEKNDIDGALLTILNLGIDEAPELMKSTADRMEQLMVASGGYARVKSNYTDPAIYEYWYEREEFVFTDLALAELDWRINRYDAGDKLLGRITQKSASDNNTIPEMYVALPCKLFPGQIGDPTGALPMVGYGAGAYILTLEAREHIARIYAISGAAAKQ